MTEPLVLLTGATGYVGGRLLRALEQRGTRLRCLARSPRRLRERADPRTEVVEGDLLEPETLTPALEGVHTAYYLVHSMGHAEDFEELDRRAATNFAEAATAAGVRRIVYLGGLGHGDDLSPHLRSRQETGRILRESGVPTIEFRASIVIGSGSLSFEMVRSLVEKLPIMITPRWVEQPAQPIAIEDLIAYLVEALDVEVDGSEIFEIGGADRVSYGEIMREYARWRSLNRRMLRVPLLTPHLSSLWLGLVTPIYARVGRKLLDGVRNATVVEDERALDVFEVRPRSIGAAIERALDHEDREFAETRWSDAISSGGQGEVPEAAESGARIVDSRVAHVDAGPGAAFAPIRRLGGDVGWYHATWLWRVRGFLDLMFGGVGMRRGRRDPDSLLPGDTLDFWRVEEFDPPEILRLRAEMKLPGRAWLQFEVSPDERGSRLRQTAIFDPRGLAGRLYWYGLYPFHAVIFRGMLRALARAGEAADGVDGVGGSAAPAGAPQPE